MIVWARPPSNDEGAQFVDTKISSLSLLREDTPAAPPTTPRLIKVMISDDDDEWFIVYVYSQRAAG